MLQRFSGCCKLETLQSSLLIGSSRATSKNTAKQFQTVLPAFIVIHVVTFFSCFNPVCPGNLATTLVLAHYVPCSTCSCHIQNVMLYSSLCKCLPFLLLLFRVAQTLFSLTLDDRRVVHFFFVNISFILVSLGRPSPRNQHSYLQLYTFE